VITACGLYLLLEKGKISKRKYWLHNVFSGNEEEKEFHTLFGRL
jgi:hypothetical protein